MNTLVKTIVSLLLIATSFQLNAEDNTTKNLKAGKNKITFVTKTMGGDLNLAGNLYLPSDFDASKKYPTIVFTGPMTQVKEQMASVYGEKFSERGYVFLAFDHSGFGESEGEIRGYENVASKINDVEDAISYLRTLPFVDREQLYGVGGCMGANTMVYTAVTDKRLKKIAVVSGMLANTLVNLKADKEEITEQKLISASESMQRFYETGTVEQFDLFNMAEAKESEVRAVREGYDYYMTPRGGAQTNPTYSHLGAEFFVLDNARWNASYIAKYMTTPVLTVYGTEASTKILSWLMFHRRANKPKKKLKIKGASHVDLYDKVEYVDQAVTGMDEFFKSTK